MPPKSISLTPQAFEKQILKNIPILPAENLPPLLPRDSYDSAKKDRPIIFDLRQNTSSSSTKAPSRPQVVLVWLHGAQQNPDNEIIRRFVTCYNDYVKSFASSDDFKIDLIHSTTHQLGEATLRYYISFQQQRESEKAETSSSSSYIVFAGGHSMGSGWAARLTTIIPPLCQPTHHHHQNQQQELSQEKPQQGSSNNNKMNPLLSRLPCILFGTGPPSFGSEGNYGLCVLGELDGDGRRYVSAAARKNASKNKSSLLTAVKLGTSSGQEGPKTALLVPHGADHSLRIPSSNGDKDASCSSEATKKTLMEIAKYCHEFVVAFCLGKSLVEWF